MSHHNYNDAEIRVTEIDIDYQKQYLDNARECDKKSIHLIKEILGNFTKEKINIFDLGCGNGNFLFHLRKKYPLCKLYGYEYSAKMLNESKRSKHLQGIKFSKIDILNEKLPNLCDVGFSTAVTYQFSEKEFVNAMKNIYLSLNKKGIYIGFELFTSHNHNLEIVEKTDFYKEGIPLHVRSYKSVEKSLKEIGFREINFLPFLIPIDLKNKKIKTDDKVKKYQNDLKTFTIKDEKKNRLMFRGSIFEPWCHIICKK